jgi:hypothetical protein
MTAIRLLAEWLVMSLGPGVCREYFDQLRC